MKEQKNTEPTKPSLFGLWDIIVYSVLITVIVLLFIFFVIIPTSKGAQGFKIVVDGTEIARYDYSLNRISVTDGYENLIDVNGNEITVYTDEDKIHYNVIDVNSKTKSAKISAANCSTSKDCVYTPAISGEKGAIVCAPHKLKIVPLSQTGLVPPQTGGVK